MAIMARLRPGLLSLIGHVRHRFYLRVLYSHGQRKARIVCELAGTPLQTPVKTLSIITLYSSIRQARR